MALGAWFGERLVGRLEELPGQLLRLELGRRTGVVHLPERRRGGVLAVGGDEEAAVRGPGSLVVPARQRLPEQFAHLERVDVHLIERALLRQVEHLVRRVGEMPGQGGEATGQLVPRNHPDLAGLVDRVRSDEQLPRLAVDHPAGARPTHALRADFQRHVRTDGEQLVVAAAERMRRVGRAPELAGPGYGGAEAAFHFRPFALGVGVEDRQVGVNPGDVQRLTRRLLGPRLAGEQGCEDGKSAHGFAKGNTSGRASEPCSARLLRI